MATETVSELSQNLLLPSTVACMQLQADDVIKMEPTDVAPAATAQLQPIIISNPQTLGGNRLLLSPTATVQTDQQQKLVVAQLSPVNTAVPSTGVTTPIINGGATSLPWLLPNGTYLNANNLTNLLNTLPNTAAVNSPQILASPETTNALSVALAQSGNQQNIVTLFNQLVTAVNLQQAINANQQQQNLIQQLFQQNSTPTNDATTSPGTTTTTPFVQIKPAPAEQTDVVKKSSNDAEKGCGSGRRRRCKKDHVCPYCGKVCVRKDYLTKHIRIHTKEKPYICERCGQRFTQKGSLNAHVNYNCRGTWRMRGQTGGVHQPASNLVLKRLKQLQNRLRSKDVSSQEDDDESGDQFTDNEETTIKIEPDEEEVIEESMKLPLGPPDMLSTDGGQSTNAESELSSESDSDMVIESIDVAKSDIDSGFVMIKAEPVYEETIVEDEIETATVAIDVDASSDEQLERASSSTVASLSSLNPSIAQILGHNITAVDDDQLTTVAPPAVGTRNQSPGRPRSGRYKRTHVCAYCGKVFARRDYLTKHIRIHTKERPYVCTLCGDRFTQKGTLNSHLNCHKSTGAYFCEICYVQFASKRSLSKHLHSHTNNTDQTPATASGGNSPPLKVAQWMATMNCNVEDALFKNKLLGDDERIITGLESGYIAEGFSAYFDELQHQVAATRVNSRTNSSSEGSVRSRNSRKQLRPMRLSTASSDNSVMIIESDDDDEGGNSSSVVAQESDDNISSCEFVVTSQGITRASSPTADTQTKKRKLGSLIDKLSQNAADNPSPYILKVPKLVGLLPKVSRRKSQSPAFRIANSQMDSFDDEDEDFNSDTGGDLCNGRNDDEFNVVKEDVDEDKNYGQFQETLATIRETLPQNEKSEKRSTNVTQIKIERSDDTDETGAEIKPENVEEPMDYIDEIPQLEPSSKISIKVEALDASSENVDFQSSPLCIKAELIDNDDETIAEPEDISPETNEEDSANNDPEVSKNEIVDDDRQILPKIEDVFSIGDSDMAERIGIENNNNFTMKDGGTDDDENELKVDTSSHVCPICSEQCVNDSELVVHLRSHRLKCNTCKRVFGSEQRWSEHMKQHNQANKCLVCGLILAKKRYLPIHMRTHTNERPYKCALCKRAFTQKGALNEHIRSHARKAVRVGKSKRK